MTFEGTVDHPQLLAGELSYALDGSPIQLGQTIGQGLAGGEHTITYTGTDALGEAIEGAVTFTSSSIPTADGVTQQSGQGAALLTARATNPSGAGLQTTFIAGDVATAGSLRQGWIHVADFDGQSVAADIQVQDAAALEDPLSPDDERTAQAPATSELPVLVGEIDYARPGQRVVWRGQAERSQWAEAYRDSYQWLADNAATRKIAFVAHTGDIIENWNGGASDEARARKQLEFASQTQKLLEDTGVLHAILPGNDDNLAGGDVGEASVYNDYFGPERYQALAASESWKAAGAQYHPWKEGDNQNSYNLFSAGGQDFVTVNLGYDVTPEEAQWASSVLKQYSTRNAIIHPRLPRVLLQPGRARYRAVSRRRDHQRPGDRRQPQCGLGPVRSRARGEHHGAQGRGQRGAQRRRAAR